VRDAELDLTPPNAPEAPVSGATGAFGQLDILVCNHVRSGSDWPLGSLDAAMLDARWAVNTRSVILGPRDPRPFPQELGALRRPGPPHRLASN
jgi:NAD(P)-dependent dehydrogenase (short-subunit alcohol dehydrogenase family)